MRQQFQQEESTQQSSPTITSAVPITENRYDQETVQQIIARATQLQVEYRETLSAQQIEAIGAEVGLDADFIRRALADIESGTATVRTQTTTASIETQPSRTALGVSSAVATSYGVLMYTVQVLSHSNNDICMLFGIFVPVLVALGLGANVNSKRWGAAMGALLSTAITASVGLYLAETGVTSQSAEVIKFWLAMTAGGMALGTLGAAIRKHGPQITKALTRKALPETAQAR